MLATVALLAAGLSSGRMAVLQFDNRVKGAEHEQVDTQYFEDEVRGIARELLPGLDLMTRQNMIEMAHANGQDPARCDESQCVEIGRTFGADTVVFGYVTRIGSTFALVLSLHETQGVGRMLTNVHAEGKSIDDLVQKSDAAIRELLQPLFAERRPGRTAAPIQEGRIGGPSADFALDEAQQAVVRFDSTPPGAVVLVDGQLICQSTPCSKAVPVGPRDVVMQKERYEQASTRARVAKGTQVALELSPVFGVVSVATTPPRIALSINGKAAGTSPLERELDPGAVEVLIADDCYLKTGERIALKKGERRSLRIEAVPRLAGLNVSSEDEQGNAVEAQVAIDGNLIGTAPGTFKVPVCSRSLKVTAEGRSYEIELSLKEKEVASVRAQLRRNVAPAPRPSYAAAEYAPSSSGSSRRGVVLGFVAGGILAAAGGVSVWYGGNRFSAIQSGGLATANDINSAQRLGNEARVGGGIVLGAGVVVIAATLVSALSSNP